MATIDIKTIDREAIEWLVSELEDFEKDKAIREGLLAATNVIKTIGRRNLRLWMTSHGHPNGVTGNLLKSFSRRIKKSKPGALAGFKRPEGSHVHLVNSGTVLRSTRYHDTGVMPASYFWDDAARQGSGPAADSILAGVQKAVNRINERRNS